MCRIIESVSAYCFQCYAWDIDNYIITAVEEFGACMVGEVKPKNTREPNVLPGGCETECKDHSAEIIPWCST